MKLKIHIITFTLLLLSQLLTAQTVVIPDSSFKACLVKKLPDILDENQNLILSKAQAYSGNLACIGFEINSIEGIEYFTNVVELNLSSNSISTINTFPINNKLTRLVLDDNLLTSLPTLSNLPNLKTITVKRNKLTSLPDLSANTKITQLYVQSNQLTYIPDLRNQKELWAINFSENSLTSLPFLDSLKKLKELVIAKNQFTQIPPLSKLASLTYLDFSSNQLSSLPVLPNINLIETVKINNNNFKILPDFSIFTNLKKAFLDDNYFTFEDLYPLVSISGYDTIFPLTSQKTLKIGQSFNIKEKDILYIKTGIDLNTSGITRTWYFENKQIQQSQKDRLKVYSDSTALSGNYYCILTSDKFPGLTLKTDNYHIKIDPCFTLYGYVVKTLPGNCTTNGGKINVTSAIKLPYGFSYQLKSTNGSESLNSANGSFTNLGSKEYSLYGVLGNCQKLIESAIKLEDEECDNVYITADGDDENDVYFFKDKGRVTISDKFGNIVSTLNIPAQWDGSGKNGMVAPGLYFANINNGKRLIKITVVY